MLGLVRKNVIMYVFLSTLNVIHEGLDITKQNCSWYFVSSTYPWNMDAIEGDSPVYIYMDLINCDFVFQ